MEPTFLTDYIRLAFRLGHLSASLGEAHGDEEVLSEWQDDIDALAERMQSLGLRQSKLYIISFLEQVGDVTQQPDLLDVLTKEANDNLDQVMIQIREDAEELRQNPGTMPSGVRDVLTPRILDALPAHAREEYEEAKRNLLAGTWTSAVRSMCVAVEATLSALYSLSTGNSAKGKSWDEMQRALSSQDSLDGRTPVYIVGLVRDIQKNYRNPVAHPDLRFSEDYEAYSAFYYCSVALQRMAEAILTKTMPA